MPAEAERALREGAVLPVQIHIQGEAHGHPRGIVSLCQYTLYTERWPRTWRGATMHDW